MSLKCPECHAWMSVHDTPTLDGRVEWIDRCVADPSCGSWYDRGEYAAIDPMLANSAARDALLNSVRLPAVSGAKPRLCPRCSDVTAAPERALVRVDFVGVALGMCPECTGVWAPAGTVDAVIKALSLYETASGGVRNMHYRSAAAAPVMRDKGALRTQCCECLRTVAFDETALDVDGLLCVPCAAARSIGEAPSQQRDAGLWGFVRSVLKDLGIR
jgi:Zn-finger nucleic acid-binding protein